MNKRTSLKLDIKTSWALPLHATTAHLETTQSLCVVLLSYPKFTSLHSILVRLGSDSSDMKSLGIFSPCPPCPYNSCATTTSSAPLQKGQQTLALPAERDDKPT